MSTSTASMWLNERPVIDLVGLSNRKQPTPPTAVRASGKRRWKEGTGWVWRLGCCLIGSCNSGGLVVVLRLCPLKHKQEGIQRAAPGPGSRRWPLWAVIMGSVAPSYPPSTLSEPNTIRVIRLCVFVREHVHIFTAEYTWMSSDAKADCMKKVCSSERVKSAWKGFMCVRCAGSTNSEINTISALTRGTGVFWFGRGTKGT